MPHTPPQHVLAMSERRQQLWLQAYNSAFQACMSAEFGGDSGWATRGDRCSAAASVMASEVLKGPAMDDITAYDERSFHLFVEATSALGKADFTQPGWIPFLPKPGKFKHPKYGEVDITTEGNQALVDSVRNRVYQEHIPLDAEHQTKLSGAVAWIKDMRLNEDGSADAFVEWTTRGQTMMTGGQFRYVSPEWFGQWSDPATGVTHKNVVAGGALTTRPFFKQGSLRALVASEDGTKFTVEQREFADMQKCPKCGMKVPAGAKTCTNCGSKIMTEENQDAAVTLTMAEVQTKIDEAVTAASAKFGEQITTLTTQLTEAQTLAASEKTARESTAAELKTIQLANRRARFAATVAGSGGANDGNAWLGDHEKHVAILDRFAETFGEDSAEVKDYIEQQSLVATESKAIFNEAGSSARGVQPTGDARLTQLVTKRMNETKETEAVAYAAVLETPEGRKIYNEIGGVR